MVKAARSNSQPPKAVLSQKKADIDKRVAELDRRRALSDQEAFELKQLKKSKLAAKDRIESSEP